MAKTPKAESAAPETAEAPKAPAVAHGPLSRTALKARIAQLEAENSDLRGQLAKK